MSSNSISEDAILGGMPPDPLVLFAQLLAFMTTHHLKVSMHTTLQHVVSLITEKLLYGPELSH